MIEHNMAAVDWELLTSEAVQHLQRLLRFDTTSSETLAVRYLSQQLEAAGVEVRIVEPTPGRPNLWARLCGNGQQRPLLLLSHLDVVSVEREHWSADPFGGEICDGYIYGRGAVDMKGMTAKQLTLLLHFAHQCQLSGKSLARDIILLAVADEECTSASGMAWIVAHAPELLDAEFALNEGGGYAVNLGGQRIYVCETAQKGSTLVTLCAHGEPGHGAFPHRSNAVVRLARAIQRLAQSPLPLHRTPTTVDFVSRLAATRQGARQLLIRQILHPLCSEIVLNSLSEQDLVRILRPMLHNTVSPTILTAGNMLNVIPGEACAQLDGRMLPGQSAAGFAREIERRIADPLVSVEVDANSHGYECSADTALFTAISAAIATHDPGAIVAPYLFPAVSDSRFLAPLGITTYGFDPLRPEAGCPLPYQLAHNHDERISIANMRFGLCVLHDIIATIVAF